MRRILVLAFAAALPSLAAAALAADRPAFTGPEFTTENASAPIARDVADDLRRTRNYPDQPPVVPHSITGYQLDLNVNKCLTCHSREFTGDSQAPMISVTHFQDRDGQTLGTVSPRRYFCTQCHVTQSDARLPVDNLFTDIDSLLRDARRAGEPR